MAVNISHVERATRDLVTKIEQSIEAIENKENEGDMDEDRINAYMNFKEIVEEQLEELMGFLEGMK